MSIKIFAVDDHFVVTEGLKTMLQQYSQIEWMGAAASANDCLYFLKKGILPDVILMDINLAESSGIDLCKEVLSKYPALHVIALSTYNQLSFIQKMFDAGASGYLLKNAGESEILNAITEVIQGKKFVSMEAAKTLRTNHNNDVIITRREKEVLLLIADGLTNCEIATNLFVSASTIETHRKNLLLKFEAKNTAVLIKMAMQLQLL